jgi:TatD DNase family protein
VSEPEPLRFTDSHCHVYDPRLDGGTPAAVEAARAVGVHRMIAVGCDAETSAAALRAAAAHEGVWATVGLHPHEARHGVNTILALLDEPGVVAIGECGLDYYYDHSPRSDQRAAFAAQIQLARERAMPLVVHTRDAWDDTFAVFAAEGVPDTTIFHCFTGGAAEARRCLDLGALVSFSGIVTFKTADAVREAAALCPLDRLLIETDSPYLAPVPYRGKTNQPAYLPHVAAAIATLKAVTVADVAEQTGRSAAIAFGLPLP